MKPSINFARIVALATVPSFLLCTARILTHCDTLEGPVVADARVALEQGDITPAIKWVRGGDEAELKGVLAKVLAVRSKGAEARELPDR